jgi:hypothetical protein
MQDVMIYQVMEHYHYLEWVFILSLFQKDIPD